MNQLLSNDILRLIFFVYNELIFSSRLVGKAFIRNDVDYIKLKSIIDLDHVRYRWAIDVGYLHTNSLIFNAVYYDEDVSNFDMKDLIYPCFKYGKPIKSFESKIPINEQTMLDAINIKNIWCIEMLFAYPIQYSKNITVEAIKTKDYSVIGKICSKLKCNEDSIIEAVRTHDTKIFDYIVTKTVITYNVLLEAVKCAFKYAIIQCVNHLIRYDMQNVMKPQVMESAINVETLEFLNFYSFPLPRNLSYMKNIEVLEWAYNKGIKYEPISQSIPYRCAIWLHKNGYKGINQVRIKDKNLYCTFVNGDIFIKVNSIEDANLVASVGIDDRVKRRALYSLSCIKEIVSDWIFSDNKHKKVLLSAKGNIKYDYHELVALSRKGNIPIRTKWIIDNMKITTQ